MSELERGLAAAADLHVLDTDLERVPVRPTATRGEAGAYRYRKGDPVDLRVSRRSERVASSFLHELGHFVDHQLGFDPDTGEFASAAHPAFAEWRAAAARLAGASFQATRRVLRYFDSPRELWARSYAQTALLSSADPVLQAHLRELQRVEDPYVWPDDQFGPVAVAVIGVFERLALAPSSGRLAA